MVLDDNSDEAREGISSKYKDGEKHPMVHVV